MDQTRTDRVTSPASRQRSAWLFVPLFLLLTTPLHVYDPLVTLPITATIAEVIIVLWDREVSKSES
jgi:predicted membrane metal-binding protein